MTLKGDSLAILRCRMMIILRQHDGDTHEHVDKRMKACLQAYYDISRDTGQRHMRTIAGKTNDRHTTERSCALKTSLVISVRFPIWPYNFVMSRVSFFSFYKGLLSLGAHYEYWWVASHGIHQNSPLRSILRSIVSSIVHPQWQSSVHKASSLKPRLQPWIEQSTSTAYHNIV